VSMSILMSISMERTWNTDTMTRTWNTDMDTNPA
jgi:hypothetical protein